MSVKHWLGTADAVAQVAQGEITANDGATTYTVTIGNEAVSVVGQANANATAAALVVALQASTHPYFTAITWDNSSGALIDATANVAGVPFVAALTVTGGAGTVDDLVDSAASAGPNDWSTAANWSDGIVPVDTDDVIIQDNAINIVWGLDQNTIDLDSLNIKQTYTGRIGLDYRAFATSIDGDTTDTTKTEYRDRYLRIGAAALDIGENTGPSLAGGSTRILIDLGADESSATIHNTASSAQDLNKSAVRLKTNNASTSLFVRNAPGGVAVADSEPDEISTLALISISDESTSSKVSAGSGTTITTWLQQGGDNLLNAAATVTTVTVNGGILLTEGDYTITTLNINGGTVFCNNIKTAGNAVTTINQTGGTLDGSDNNEARTWATVSPTGSSTIKIDGSIVTITAFVDPGVLYTQELTVT